MKGIITKSNNPKDWPEDFEHENGCYQNKCHECGSYFMGYKRRLVCKECATPNWIEIAKKQPPEDCKGNQAWHGAWLEGEMVGFAKCTVEIVAPLKAELANKFCSCHNEIKTGCTSANHCNICGKLEQSETWLK